MPTSFEWYMGFSCCSMVILLYLLNGLIDVLKELVSILREYLNDD